MLRRQFAGPSIVDAPGEERWGMEQTLTGASTSEGKLLPKAVIRAPERRNSKNSWFGTML
jgi:hypothetical protein